MSLLECSGVSEAVGGGVSKGAGMVLLMEVQVLSLVASTEGGPGAGPHMSTFHTHNIF